MTLNKQKTSTHTITHTKTATICCQLAETALLELIWVTGDDLALRRY
jgi:hypothetical protein